MLRVNLLLLIWFAGYTAANEDCNINPALRCADVNFQIKFPENEDDTQNLCNGFIEKTECFLTIAKSCEGDRNEIKQMEKVISYLTEHCQANDTIYQGVMNNLGCIKPIFNPNNDECRKVDDEKAIKFMNYLMQLSKRGIKHATDDDNNMMKCLDVLYFDGCIASEVGKKCGSVARNSVVNVIQNLDINLKICKQEIIDDLATLVNMFES